MVSFETITSQSSIREGRLVVGTRQVATPVVVPSIDTLQYLTSAQLTALNNQALFFDPLQLAMSMGAKVANLGQVMEVHQVLIATSGGETAYKLAKPRGRKRDGVNFHRPDNQQLIHFTPVQALELQEQLGASIGEQLSREEDYYAPVDDLVAASTQTSTWLRTMPTNHSLLAPVVGGGLHQLRTQCISSVPGHVLGYSLKQLDQVEDITELDRILRQTIQQLRPDKMRVAKVGNDAVSVMTTLAAGVDVIESDAALTAARQGIAWTAGRNLDLSKAHFATDQRQIDDTCQCPVCAGHYRRQGLNYLLAQSAPLATTLLLQHNLAYLRNAADSLRQAITAGHYDQWTEHYCR